MNYVKILKGWPRGDASWECTPAGTHSNFHPTYLCRVEMKKPTKLSNTSSIA